MSQNDDQNIECPLCMEPFEMDDFNFFPCTCGYQICRFCWHRIRTDENGLCPACRKQYPEDPADFKPLTVEEWQKIKNEKRQKDQQKKQKLSESRKHLDNVRVVQKNLVFVVGLPARLADPEHLKKHDYFGKFGKIHKVVVNQSTSYAGSQGPSASAYVTYCKPEDALRAIKSVNNIQVDGRTLKASLGTTKYCSHFLKNQLCPKTDCMYLHELGDEAASFTKEDMQLGKHQEYEKKLQDQILGPSITSNNTSGNNKKQTVSQASQQNSTNSGKESWPCAVQNAKESRSNRSKESQNQKSEGKNSRSKNKHSSEGQKSKKNKNKSSDSVQNSSNSSKSSTKDESSGSQKKTQKGRHKDPSPAQSSAPRIDGLQSNSNKNSGKLTDVLEMNNKNAQQTTYVQITEQPLQSKPVSASIKIARSESPVLPPSPISSSSSSLFTPFGSLSSNFLSSSSPSPPPSSNNPLTFGNLGSSTNIPEQGSPVGNFVAPSGMEQQKRQSPNHLFNNLENSDSLFSHMNYHPGSSDCGSYNGHGQIEEPSVPDNSDWSSNYSFGETHKQMPEDDLDFDPWNESSKGLADLMAKEAVRHPPYHSELPTPPGLFQPIKAPVPSQQRVAVPPPGFSSRQVTHSSSLNHLPGMFAPASTDYLSSKLLAFREQRQNLNGCTQHYFSENSPNTLGMSNQFKLQQQQQQQPQQYPQPMARDILENFCQKKNLDERFRSLFPEMLYQMGARNLQKSQTQTNLGPSWNHQNRDASWVSNDSHMLHSGNITDAQRGSPQLWMKALQHLQVDENSQYNIHSPYPNPFALRGQWPAAQCPPPGFAPSRSPASTPFQHMPVNQKI